MWPPENLAGLAEVRAHGGIATAAGENYGTTWEFRRAFEAGAITYAQPSVTKIGGVTEMRRVMTLGEMFGVQVVPHSAYFGPGLLASIHCIAAMAADSPVERFYCDFADNPLGDAIHPKGGRIEVPQGPGLGASRRFFALNLIVKGPQRRLRAALPRVPQHPRAVGVGRRDREQATNGSAEDVSPGPHSCSPSRKARSQDGLLPKQDSPSVSRSTGE